MSATLLFLAAAEPVALPWGRLGLVLLGTVVFVCLVALCGRWLAATHPDAVVASPGPAPAVPVLAAAPEFSPALVAVLTAAAHEALGGPVRLTSVELVPSRPPSVEAMMQAWSLEGRRQIYTSHKVR